MLYYTELKMPTGRAYAAATDTGLCRLELKPGALGAWLKMLSAEYGEKPVRDDDKFALLNMELASYFKGRLRNFSVPLDVQGTAFQKRVWAALLNVRYGSVVTYGGLAVVIRKPNAARAVGGAVGANRVPIIIPCHRVVATGGGIGGYGSGVDIKRRLLELEGVLPPYRPQ